MDKAVDKALSIPVESIEEARELHERPLTKAFLEDTFAEVPNYEVRGPAELKVWLTRLSGRDVLLEAKTTVTLGSDCRRCLKDVESKVPVAFTLSLVARPLDASGKPKKDDDSGEDEFSSSFDDTQADEEPFDGETVHLAPIVREQLLLGIPSIEPICREDCKGLCSTCGQDLNEKDCGHTQKVPDPRWAALKDIKVQ